jgi:hypothetical protein
MPVRWLLVLFGAIAAEVLAVLLLFIIVALLGPGEAAADLAFAERIGNWVGPIGGGLATLAIGWWVARRSASPLLHGSLVGILVAAIDVALLVAGGAGFRLLFLASAVGRIVAGALGGLLAQRQADVEVQVHG